MILILVFSTISSQKNSELTANFLPNFRKMLHFVPDNLLQSVWSSVTIEHPYEGATHCHFTASAIKFVRPHNALDNVRI